MKQKHSYIYLRLDTGPLTWTMCQSSTTELRNQIATEGLRTTLAEIVALIRHKYCQLSVNKEVPSTNSSCWDYTITLHYNALAQPTYNNVMPIFYIIHAWSIHGILHTCIYVKWLFHVGTGCFQDLLVINFLIMYHFAYCQFPSATLNNAQWFMWSYKRVRIF